MFGFCLEQIEASISYRPAARKLLPNNFSLISVSGTVFLLSTAMVSTEWSIFKTSITTEHLFWHQFM